MSSVLSKPDTGENNRTKGGPGYTLGLHKLRISLPICYYFFFLVSSGVGGGREERENRRGEQGVVATGVKCRTWAVFLFSLPLEHGQHPSDSKATVMRVPGRWEHHAYLGTGVEDSGPGWAGTENVDAPPPNPGCHHSSWRVGGWLGHSMFPCFSDPWEVHPHEKDKLNIQRAPVMLCHAT